MWWTIGVVAGGAVLVLSGFLWRRRCIARWKKSVRELLGRMEADATFDDQLETGVKRKVWSVWAETYFLHGCQLLRRGSPARAALSFQLAHHGCPAYESAALLVFTCMKMSDSDMDRLLEFLLETWSEMRRGDLPSCRREALFLSVLEASPVPEAMEPSPLAQALRKLPIPILQEQIDRALTERSEWARPLFAAGSGTRQRTVSRPATQTAAS